MMWWMWEYFERWRIDVAYRLLHCVYSHKDFEHHWYPQILIMQIDENLEWLVNCQKLIAVAEWIKDGAASNIVAVLCEKHIGESCLNAHHLVVSYENLSELNETASAVIQCSGLGILKPNTIIIDFPKYGSSSNFLYAGQSELWNRIAATIDKCLLICKGDLWKPVPFNLASTLDLWWVVEGDDLLLSFIYIMCRNYRWTFTKLRIFAVIKVTEFEAVKDQVSKRIQQASLEVDNIEFRPVIPDDIAAYGYKCSTAKFSTSNQNIQQEEGSKERRIYKNESPLRLNNLIRKESINADLIMFNLPRPRGDMPTSRLLQILDVVTEHLTRVVRKKLDFTL
ncbi:hypothetical protein X798_06007 [Onchocerca flexuosa]|uniref:SLC12A transporter C-terminal domain-containing protein n=1 Tax=Onchocerca flexuosa TaxID=387005 RepID=A0A238BQP7_9BILA|nr:hypothetical protein X798_06007 [Onchocerca flexuosa]